MVSGPRIEGGAQVLSAGLRRTIQSIKEIVGKHSDAEIYLALKETNMDPNETTQKLLNQDPFHEVKRKRDRKKENSGYKSHVAAEPRKDTEVAQMTLKYGNYSDRNVRRGGYGRNVASGSSLEFRVVRDNRVSLSASADKPGQSSTSKTEGAISSGSMDSNLTQACGHKKLPTGQHSSRDLNSPADSQCRRTKDSTSVGDDCREMHGENHPPISNAASRMQTKENGPQRLFTSSSGSSILGVYSSSSDPVDVPSSYSRSAANVGAFRREVGVVGPRWQSYENSSRPSAPEGTSLPNIKSGRGGHSGERTRPFNAMSKIDWLGQNVAPESAIPGFRVARSFSHNQYGSRSRHLMGHQKVSQHAKEWKPKSSQKSNVNGPRVVGSPTKTVSPSVDNTEDLKKELDQMQDSMSSLNLSENQNVIIAAHIRVSETDRCRLTFGSLGTESDAPMNSVCPATEGAEELSNGPSVSVSVSVPESLGDEPADSKQLEMMEESTRSSGSSHASGAASDHRLREREDSSSKQNLDNYADVGLVGGDSPSYTPESLRQQDTSEVSNFSGYGPQMGHDTSYFRLIIDETIEVPGLPSSQEVLTTHTTNAIPASTIAMVQQQQQQQLTQMYPQLHVSHFANVMPYRQFLSPVYVPPMPVPGYSNSPAYPHPSNGGSYVVMPGNGSHLTPSGVKYGIQQFKPVPTGSSTVFGNFTSPIGYAVNTPGVIGSAAGHDDSSRLKYKDGLYVANPQADTSEIWMNPRDIPGVQSTSYYNMPGRTPQSPYLTSHNGHAAAQSSNVQFPGVYHPPPQPTAIASPHHLGPAIGGNVGVGVAAPGPGAQIGTYQQPQFGHLNWTGNF